MRNLKYFGRFVLSVFILPKNIILYLIGYVNKGKSKVGDALYSQGYYVYDEPLEAHEVKGLINTYQDLLQKETVVSEGQSNGRIMMPHLKSKEINAYIEKFLPVARDYFAHMNIKVELTMFQKSKVETVANNIPGGGYHVDDNKKNLKFFIYLSDVTVKNGPFTLSPYSHGLSWYKFVRWWGWEVTLDRKFFYLESLPKGCENPIEVLGEQGTVFCADTTIYHKAARVVEGERLVLVISFAEKRLDPYTYLSNKEVLY